MSHVGSKYRRPSSIQLEDDDCYWVKGVRMILPETKVPTIALKISEMKNKTTYWQIGTASVSRVKINSLRPDVGINTAEAGRITGMFSENYGPIDTLGTAIINILGMPIKVHVTRSANTAPVVADGVLGYDFLGAANVTLNLSSQTMTFNGRRSSIPMFQGKELIPDYLHLLKRRMIASSIEIERGAWSVVSKPLAKLREYLPEKITKEEGAPIIEILEEYVDCFHLPGEKLGATKVLTYSIKSKTMEPINILQHELSAEDDDEIDRQVDELLHQGIIGISTSPYNSPMRIIERKPDSKGNGKYRMSADFHELNNRCVGDNFPIPDIIDLVDQLYGSKYFTVLDLASACYQIELVKEDRKKTAFTTRSGRYEFKRMPIGIRNASQTIQRLMGNVLNGMLAANMVFVCYDDILIHAASVEEHEVRVRRVLSLIRKAGLKLQPDKCQLFQPCVMFLGYLITYEGLRPNPEKIKKLIAEEMPATDHDLSSYLGLLSNFKRFIPDFSSKCKPMYSLLKNKGSFVWNREAIDSFNDLKKDISKDLLLQYPHWDMPFILEASATKYGFHAALMQPMTINGQPWTIAYASRSYLAEEVKYNKYDKERVAAMYGMDTWYWYFNDVEGKEFILRTGKPEAFDLDDQEHNSNIFANLQLKFGRQKFRVEPLTKR